MEVYFIAQITGRKTFRRLREVGIRSAPREEVKRIFTGVLGESVTNV